MRVKCLAQEHNVVPQPGLETEPFDPESSALTIMPLCVSLYYIQPLNVYGFLLTIIFEMFADFFPP